MAARPSWQRRPLIGLLVLVALVLTAYLVGRDAPSDRDELSGLPVVEVGNLPAGAKSTLELIEAGGPFPYEEDGGTFGNREGLLPDRPADYYREYTVPTPDEDDRGPRRLVTGQQGEVYYTADHYDSFVRVLDP